MNICKYLDWKFRGTTWFVLLVSLVCIVAAFLLPESFANKNSPIETLQLVILAVALGMSCTVRDRKTLYIFVSLCLFFAIAREVNYGRTLFIFADPEDVNKFPKWKDMEYGWLAHVCVGIYLAWTLVYFIWRKLWREVWDVLSTTRIPAIDLIFALAGFLAGQLFEMQHDNIREELGETVFYVAVVGMLYLYSRNKVTRTL